MVLSSYVLFLATALLLLSLQVSAFSIETCPGTEEHSCSCAKTEAGISCPAGSYCPEFNATIYPQLVAENDCTVRGDGVVECPCTPGFYCPENVAQPVYCCKRFYCPQPTEIKPCPEGHYCQEGFVEPLECETMAKCPKYTYKPSSASTVVLLLVLAGLIYIGFTLIEFRKKKRQELQEFFVEEEKRLRKEHDIIRDAGLEDDEPEDALETELIERNSLASSSFDIEFKNIDFTLANGTEIMKDVSGEFKAGRLCAIMGPSGAGKTTIINLITGKAPKTGGHVLINGKEEDLSNYKKLLGFVPQEDIMIRSLSVRNNVAHSAKMRLPDSYSKQQLDRKVAQTLVELGISHVQHSIIGDERERGISGGQRKRVNIALELVADPVVLFLDEPTSGLDSTTSTSLCKTLKKIARRRQMTIAAVIHQPSMSAFLEFDDLLLLGKGGRVVYHGPIEEAPTYFEKQGFPLPKTCNPADFYLDVTTGEVERMNHPEFDWPDLFDLWHDSVYGHPDEHDEKESLNDDEEGGEGSLNNSTPSRGLSRRNTISDLVHSRMTEAHVNMAIYNEPYANPLVFIKEYLEDVAQTIQEAYQYSMNNLKETFSSDEIEDVRKTPGALAQFGFCFTRARRQVFRNYKQFLLEQLLHFGCGLFISVAADDLNYIGPYPSTICITGALPTIKDCELPQSDNYTQIGNFLAWGIGFAGIASASITFGLEQVNYWRESSVGLKTIPYFFAKLLADIPRMVVAAAFFFAAFKTKFVTTASNTSIYTIILLLYWFGFSLGYLVSQLVPIEKAALTGVLVALVFAIGFSGSNPSMKDVENKPSGVKWLWDVSGPRWALEAFYVENVQYFETVPSGPLKDQDYIDIQSGLDNRGYDIDAYSKDLVYLFVCGLSYSLIALFLMIVRHGDKKK